LHEFALVIGLGFLVAPPTALFAGLFPDEIAEASERTWLPGSPAWSGYAAGAARF
jgi:CysZ protein